MPRGQKTRNQGGSRRTFCLPCGKAIQGNKSRLQGKISAHQKVCPLCAATDCSAAWKKEVVAPNLNCLRGGNSGNNRAENSTRVSYLNSETGEEFVRQVAKVGGTTDTVCGERDIINSGDFDPASFKPQRPNKKRKGKKKGQKKSKVQSGWGDEAAAQAHEARFKKLEQYENISTFDLPDGHGAIIEIDEDNLDDVMRLLQSLTADLTPEELIETINPFEAAKNKLLQ